MNIRPFSFKSIDKVPYFLLIIGIMLSSSGINRVSTVSAQGAEAVRPVTHKSISESSLTANDLSHRYIIFLNGILTSASETSNFNLESEFGFIKKNDDHTGLVDIGLSPLHFVYFSYSAASRSQMGGLYCSGWKDGCSIKNFGDLAALSLSPIYASKDTQLPVDQQANVLDWLIRQIVKQDNSAKIDLVGWSLGGLVSSYWAWRFGDETIGDRSIRDIIHSIVMIESPVGGLPLAQPFTEGCKSTDLACNVWKAALDSIFGAQFLRNMQVEFPGVDTIPDSIVDKLYLAAKKFHVTSIESENDYIVNGTFFPLCKDIDCKPAEALYTPVGFGTQDWRNIVSFTPHIADLGGQLVTSPVYNLSLVFPKIGGVILDNHRAPLHDPKTAQWVSAAIQGCPQSGSDCTAPPVDVYMLVDLSDSFSDDLPNFKIQAPTIMSKLKAANPDTRFGLGKFEDYPIPPFGEADNGDQAYQRLIDLTFDTDSVLNAISGLFTRSGDDEPESQLAALYQAATGSGQDLSSAGFPGASIPPGQQANFRNGATKIIILWTDAPFHHAGDPGAIPYPGPTFNDTVNAILALDPPKVIGISSGGGGRADLEAIASATNAVASSEGVDCDNDGIPDIEPGGPLVCEISASGEGIGAAISALVGAASIPSGAPVSTTVNPTNVDLGGTALVSVSLNNVPAEGYSSAEFSCTYDNRGVARSNIFVGNLFGADPVMVVSPRPSIPEISSFIVAIAGSNGAKATTSGAVFTFGLTAQQVGMGQISIECEARASKGDGNVITLPSSGPATLTIGGESIPPTASQTATPTGSTTPIVTATLTASPTALPPSPLNGQVLAGKRQVTIKLFDASNTLIASVSTNPDGTFSLTAPAGRYSVLATASGFLSAQGLFTITDGNTTTLPAIHLLAGDIDGNDIIDPLDALTIGMNYGAATPAAADLNDDGVINFLDLELLAANYRRPGPITWQ